MGRTAVQGDDLLRRTNHAAVIASSVALCAAMLFGIASAPVAGQPSAKPALQPVAILTVISGDVLMRSATGDFDSAMDGTVLYVGTVLRTSADARALITFFEGSTVELDPASDITIEDATARSGSTLAQAFGRGLNVVMHITTADSRYERTTPAATASVRGIEFEIAVATGHGALPTTLMPSAQLVSPTVAIPASLQIVAPAQTTTVRANTATVSTQSASRGENVRLLVAPLTLRAPSAERSRDRDDERDEDVGEKD